MLDQSEPPSFTTSRMNSIQVENVLFNFYFIWTFGLELIINRDPSIYSLISLSRPFHGSSGESRRMAELPDLVGLPLPNGGPTHCSALVLIMRNGKVNKFYKVEYMGTLRNNDLLLCPLSALASSPAQASSRPRRHTPPGGRGKARGGGGIADPASQYRSISMRCARWSASRRRREASSFHGPRWNPPEADTADIHYNEWLAKMEAFRLEPI